MSLVSNEDLMKELQAMRNTINTQARQLEELTKEDSTEPGTAKLVLIGSGEMIKSGFKAIANGIGNAKDTLKEMGEKHLTEKELDEIEEEALAKARTQIRKNLGRE